MADEVNPRPATLVSSRSPEPPLCRPLPADLSAPLLTAELANRPGPGARPARGLAAPGHVPTSQASQRRRQGLALRLSGRGGAVGGGGAAAVSSPPPCAPDFQTPAPWSCSSRLFFLTWRRSKLSRLASGFLGDKDTNPRWDPSPAASSLHLLFPSTPLRPSHPGLLPLRPLAPGFGPACAPNSTVLPRPPPPFFSSPVSPLLQLPPPTPPSPAPRSRPLPDQGPGGWRSPPPPRSTATPVM